MPRAALDAGHRTVAVGSEENAVPALRLAEQRQYGEADFEGPQSGAFDPRVERRAGAVALDLCQSVVGQGRLIGIGCAPGELVRRKILAELDLERPIGEA